MSESKAGKRERLYHQALFNAIEDILITMEDRDWSRTELAREMGKNKSAVTRLLSGDRNLTLRTLSDIAFALEKKARVVFEDLPKHSDVNERHFIPAQVGNWPIEVVSAGSIVVTQTGTSQANGAGVPGVLYATAG